MPALFFFRSLFLFRGVGFLGFAAGFGAEPDCLGVQLAVVAFLVVAAQFFAYGGVLQNGGLATLR